MNTIEFTFLIGFGCILAGFIGVLRGVFDHSINEIIAQVLYLSLQDLRRLSGIDL